MAEPALRASGAQLTLELINALPEPLRARIRERIPSALLETVTRATSLSWLPIATHAALVNGVNSLLGVDEQRKFQQQMSKAYANLPMIKPIINLAARIGAISPKGLIKTVPVSWGLMARDCGKVQFVDSLRPDEAAVLMTLVPPEILLDAAYVDWMAASFHSVFDLCNTRGTVTPVADPAGRTIRFVFCWPGATTR